MSSGPPLEHMQPLSAYGLPSSEAFIGHRIGRHFYCWVGERMVPPIIPFSNLLSAIRYWQAEHGQKAIRVHLKRAGRAEGGAA